MTVRRIILKRANLHPYQFRKAQSMFEEGFHYSQSYSTSILRETLTNFSFCRLILWTDEATFTRRDMSICIRYLHTQVGNNFQSELSVNVQTGVIDNLVIGLCIFPVRLHATYYLQFLIKKLPPLLVNVSLNIRRHMFTFRN